MSYKHVKDYYVQVEQQYMEALSDTADYKQAFEDGYLSQEQLEQAENLLYALKQNYERLSYIMYLFNKPNKPNKAMKYEKQFSYLDEWLKARSATKKSVIEENENVLVNYVKYIKDLQNKGEDK